MVEEMKDATNREDWIEMDELMDVGDRVRVTADYPTMLGKEGVIAQLDHPNSRLPYLVLMDGDGGRWFAHSEVELVKTKPKFRVDESGDLVIDKPTRLTMDEVADALAQMKTAVDGLIQRDSRRGEVMVMLELPEGEFSDLSEEWQYIVDQVVIKKVW